MELSVDITGDVVEWQELLNGTQTVTLEGASGDGVWTASGIVSWNIGLEASAGEGDLTLARQDGAEVYATLVRADVTEQAERDAADTAFTLHLEYEIDGGAGAFEGLSGRARGEGSLSRAAFELTVRISA